jgi:hypothetical protein
VLLFHHDPLHSDDFLDSFCGDVGQRWQDLGGRPERVELATERRVLEIAPAPAPTSVPATPAGA